MEELLSLCTNLWKMVLPGTKEPYFSLGCFPFSSPDDIETLSLPSCTCFDFDLDDLDFDFDFDPLLKIIYMIKQ